jgi:hypothetical protein
MTLLLKNDLIGVTSTPLVAGTPSRPPPPQSTYRTAHTNVWSALVLMWQCIYESVDRNEASRSMDPPHRIHEVSVTWSLFFLYNISIKSTIFFIVTPCSSDVSEQHIVCIFRVETQAELGLSSVPVVFLLGLYFRHGDGRHVCLRNVGLFSNYPE